MTDPGGAMTDNGLREAVIAACRALTQRGLTHGTSGNVSVRRDEQCFFMSPTGLPYDALEPDSSRFEHSPRRHVFAAHAVAVGALPLKQQHLQAVASQDSSDRRACNACPDDNHVGIVRLHTMSLSRTGFRRA